MISTKICSTSHREAGEEKQKAQMHIGTKTLMQATQFHHSKHSRGETKSKMGAHKTCTMVLHLSVFVGRSHPYLCYVRYKWALSQGNHFSKDKSAPSQKLTSIHSMHCNCIALSNTCSLQIVCIQIWVVRPAECRSAVVRGLNKIDKVKN